MERMQQSYILPFSVKKGRFLLYSTLVTVLTAALWLQGNYETREIPFHDTGISVILFAAWLLMMAVITFRCATKLHILPEGIAVTLFGRTLRRIPAEQINLLAGFRENTYKVSPMFIAVCIDSLEEFQNWGTCCSYAEPWEGERVQKYIGRISSIVRSLNLHSKVLLLDWAPERLEILRQMYPDVMWLDCTEKKLFDTQLNNA